MSRVDRLGERSRVALSTISQSAANLLAAVLGVVGIHVATGALGPSSYGRFVTVVSFVTLFSILNDLGISSVGPRELARAPEAAPTILGDNLVLRTITSGLLAPLVIGVGLLAYPSERLTVGVGIALMTIDLLLTAIQTTALTWFAARVRGDVAAFVVLLGKVVYLGGIFAARGDKLSFLGYVGAYLVGDAIAGAVAVGLLVRRVRPRLRLSLAAWRQIVAGSFKLGVVQIVATVYYYNAILLLSIFRPSADVAFFGLAVNVLLILGSTSVYFVTALLPAMSTTDRAGFGALLQSAMDLVTVVAVPIAVGGFLLRSTLVTALAGDRFAAAATPLGILVIATAMTFGLNVFGIAAVAVDKPGVLLRVQLPLLAVNVCLGLVLVPTFGTVGGASALLASESISFLLMQRRFTQATETHLTFRRAWRVAIASAPMIPAYFLARPLWRHLAAIPAFAIGVGILGTVFVLALLAVRGVPDELTSLVAVSRARRRAPTG